MNSINARLARVLKLEKSIVKRTRKPVATRRRRNASGPKRNLSANHPTAIAQRYLSAMTCPRQVTQAYVPNAEAVPSLKSGSKCQLNVTLPAANDMFIFCVPCASSDTPQLFVYTGTTASIAAATFTVTTGVTIQSATVSQLPYNRSNLDSGAVSFRGVSAEILVSYTGTALNLGGRYLVYSESTRQGLIERFETDVLGSIISGANSNVTSRYISLGQCPTCDVVEHIGVGRSGHVNNVNDDPQSWVTIQDSNAQSSDVHRTTNITIGGLTRSVPSSFVHYSNASGNAVSFSVEYWVNVEYHGGSAVPFHTPSPPHVNMVAQVNQAVVQAKSEHHKHAHNPFRAAFRKITNTAKNSIVSSVTNEAEAGAADAVDFGLAALFA